MRLGGESAHAVRCGGAWRKFLLASGSIALVIGSPSYAGPATYTYDDLGRITGVNYANGAHVTYQYDTADNRTVLTKTIPSPSAGADSKSTGFNTPLTFDPRTNDTDPNGLALTITAVGLASHGTTAFTGTSVTYTPASTYSGTDTFTYSITDANGWTATGTVTVTIADGIPVAVNDSISTAYNTAKTFDPRTNDSDPNGDALTVTAVGTAGHGTPSFTSTSVTYTPTAGYYGADSFTYTISDGRGGTASATVSVTVATPAAPTAGNVSLSTAYNTAGSIGLTPSGVYSSLAVATNPAHGSASISGTTATFTPTAGYYGSDSFTYTATGPGGTSAPATVSVTVGTPAAPTAGNVSLSTAYNTAGSVGLTPSGVYSSLAVATNPAHGSASISGTTATFTPTAGYYGSDSFTYRATGPGGTSAPATVSVTVGLPAAPTAGNVSLSTAYNTAGSVGLTPSGVYTSLAVATNPAHGSASISGTTATFTPAAGYYGSDSFTYTATGPGGTSAPATVSVTVGLPAAPTAGNVSLSTSYNTAGSVALAPSGVYSSLAVAASPAHGSASISGTTATYTPAAGYYGADSFTYTATGPGGTSSQATVSVTVATPAAPTVGNVSLSTGYNTAGSVALSPSGVYSSLAVASGPAHGSASISGTTATYTPTAGYYGSDSFTYTATGPGGTSSQATVSVTVGTPAAPTVGNASLTTAYNTAGSVGLSPSGVYSSLAVASGPAHGSASISGTTATYTPTAGYYGSDSFTYNATGPGGTSAPATVSVTVGNPAAPTVGNVSLTTSYNTAGSVGLSPSGVYSSLAVAGGPAHGSASISGTTATYTPNAGYSGGDSFTYTATGPGGTSAPATVSVTVQPKPTVVINVTSSSTLRALADSAGYNANADYQFVVPAGTTIIGGAGSGAGIVTGTWGAGQNVSLIVNGSVYGGGGNGGDGSCTNLNAGSGGSGGDAIYVQAPVSVTVNSGGAILSGGGGGGGAGDYGVSNGHGGAGGSCGAGGGGGFPDGSGGQGSTSTIGLNPASAGSAGTTSGGGAGGSTGLPGGAGGGAAAAGGTGATGNSPGVGGPGGAAGYAIRFNGNSVTISNSGTINGTQG